jgi:hypothetical protein
MLPRRIAMKIPSLLLCFMASAFMLCTSCGEPKGSNVKTIKIHVANDRILVTPRCQDLNRDRDERAAWEITPPDLKFKVRFDKPQGSPFGSREFDNKNSASGQIVIAPVADGQDQFFPYSVEVEGYDPIDPGIIIW